MKMAIPYIQSEASAAPRIDENSVAAPFVAMRRAVASVMGDAKEVNDELYRNYMASQEMEDIDNAMGYQTKFMEIQGEYNNEVAQQGEMFAGHTKLWDEKYKQRVQNLDYKFSDPKLAVKFKRDKEHALVLGNLAASRDAIAARRGANKRNAEANINYFVDNRDYDSANAAVDSATGVLFTPDEARAKKWGIDRNADMHRLKDMTINEPDKFWEILEDGLLDKRYSAVEQEQFRSLLKTGQVQNERNEFLSTLNFIPKDKINSKNNPAPEFTGRFTKRECDWINAIQGGQFDNVEQDIQSAVIEEANASPFLLTTNPETRAQKKSDFIHKWKQFGVKEGFLDEQWEMASKASKEIKYPTIDSGMILDRLDQRGALRNDKQISWFKQQIQEYPDMYKIAESKTTGINKKTINKDKLAKIINAEELSHKSLTRKGIMQDFVTWRTTTPEGKDASMFVQEERLLSLVKQHTGNNDLVYTPSLNEADKMVGNAKKAAQEAQYEKFKKWAEKNDAGKVEIDTRIKASPLQKTVLSYDTTHKDLPVGVLIPKKDVEQYNAKNYVMEVTFDNKKFRRFKIVGVTDAPTPQLSYNVAKQGRFRTNSAYTVQARFVMGDLETLMKQQESAPKPPRQIMLEDGLLPEGVSAQEYEDKGLLPPLEPEEATPVAEL